MGEGKEEEGARCYKDATLRPAVGWTQPTGRHIGEILQRPLRVMRTDSVGDEK